jgi:hypothetical protein
MLTDHKSFMYSAGLFAGASIVIANLPEDHALCIDTHLMCRPVIDPLHDRPSNDEPTPITLVSPPVATSVSTVQLSARSSIMLKGAGSLQPGANTLTMRSA